MKSINRKKIKEILKQYFSLIIILFVSVTLVTGCAEDEPTNPNNGSNAIIKGRVTNQQGFNKFGKITAGVEGATVFLARVKADGSLETVSVNDVQTNSEGEFTLETSVDGESGLVAVANKDNTEWRGMVSSEVRSGITVYVQTMNRETTEEARVYEEKEANNYSNLRYFEIASHIDGEIAGKVEENNEQMQIASVLNARSNAHMQAFTELGGTQNQWNSIITAQHNAQATLERDLYYAETESAIETAFNNYFDAMVTAYTNNGVSASTYGKTSEISSRVLINQSSSLTGELSFFMKRKANKLKAIIIDQAVQSQFKALGATQVQLSPIITAGGSLQASISNASNYQDILNAWSNYQSEIMDQLEVRLGTYGELLVTMNSSIITLKATLEAAVGISASTQEIINAYIEFYNQTLNVVESTLGGASQTQVSATAELLILLNANF